MHLLRVYVRTCLHITWANHVSAVAKFKRPFQLKSRGDNSWIEHDDHRERTLNCTHRESIGKQWNELPTTIGPTFLNARTYVSVTVTVSMERDSINWA